jgi:hypothetical protein
MNQRTEKAKVIRGVYIRGVAYGEGAIVDVSAQEMQELKSTNYVVSATPDDLAPKVDTEVPKARGKAKVDEVKVDEA